MAEEFYLIGGCLISKSEWEGKINHIQESILEEVEDKGKARRMIAQEVQRAVGERIPEGKKFGVMFSGGVDSSLIALIAKKAVESAGKDFICYTLGFQDNKSKEPEDVEFAIQAAKELGLKLRTKVLSLNQAEALVKRTAKILGPGLNNAVNVGVGGVVLGCVEMAKEDGISYLFSGLGSEEIFAGYHRHKLAKDKQVECWQGLLAMYDRDLLRDNAIARATGTSLLTPFLDEKLIASAMSVPGSLKMNDKHHGNSKLILREAAEGLGLPEKIAWRGKRAAQYGSRLDKAIEKLAHNNKLKYKKDYLKSLN
ncbi:asparagine synthetase B [Candidatus Woesearchaeota archaeon]|nr:asparagine synthetase B [Candidatus Woesearchaeota archaeon]